MTGWLWLAHIFFLDLVSKGVLVFLSTSKCQLILFTTSTTFFCIKRMTFLSSEVGIVHSNHATSDVAAPSVQGLLVCVLNYSELTRSCHPDGSNAQLFCFTLGFIYDQNDALLRLLLRLQLLHHVYTIELEGLNFKMMRSCLECEMSLIATLLLGIYCFCRSS